MDYSQYANSQYNYSQYPYAQQQQQQQQQEYAQAHQQYPGQYQQYQQQHQQQYQSHAAPTIRNPFAPPTSTNNASSFDPEYEAQVAQWQSAYAPQDPADKTGKPSKSDPSAGGAATATTENPAGIAGITAAGPSLPASEDTSGKKKTVVRKGGGQTWEDSTLLEWDPTQFRIMVGNLAGEVTDDSLAKAFAQYGVAKARVVRDKRTTKSRGYGFVSFTDGEMGFKAAREMTGKYIGSHPVTIQRSKTDLRPTVQKDRHGNKGKFSKNNNNGNNKNDNKGNNKKEADPLRAHTGAHIEKKPVRNANGMKMLG